jgi:hypothetical protein
VSGLPLNGVPYNGYVLVSSYTSYHSELGWVDLSLTLQLTSMYSRERMLSDLAFPMLYIGRQSRPLAAQIQSSRMQTVL